jgi:hypothetical protein
MDASVARIPADGGSEVAISELSERDAFGGVVLAQVVGKRPELFGVAFGEGRERTTGTDGTRSSHTFVSRNQACLQGEVGCGEST